MSNQNAHKPGYKHTPLGWIPEEWEIKKLRSIGDFKGGGTPDTSNPNYWNGNIPWVSPKDMKTDEICETEDYITDEALKASSANLISENSLLLVTRSGILRSRVPIAINRKAVSINQDLKAFRLKESDSIDFIFHFLKHNNHNLIFQTAKVGTTVESLDFEALKNFSVVFPPFNERKKIAAILSTWDEAINKTQQLIAQLQQRNKGLMQQLLTGKKRLKGFEEEWKNVSFEECFEMLRSYPIPRDGLSTNNDPEKIFCIHYGDIHATYKTIFLDFNKEQSIPQIIDKNLRVNEDDILKDGDIIIADVSEDYEGVGEAVEVKNIQLKKAVGGLHTIVIRENKGMVAKNFLAFLFAGEMVKNTLRKKATGTSVYSISRSALKSLTFVIPCIHEQIAIAEFISTAVDEVQLYEQKLAALQQQKKGLMQKLLTGEVRVKIEQYQN